MKVFGCSRSPPHRGSRDCRRWMTTTSASCLDVLVCRTNVASAAVVVVATMIAFLSSSNAAFVPSPLTLHKVPSARIFSSRNHERPVSSSSLSSSCLRLALNDPNDNVERPQSQLTISTSPSRLSPLPKQRYVRIVPRTLRRGSNPRRTFDIQTAVATFDKIDPLTGQKVTLDLHAQIHFGDEEYYNYYNDITAFSSKYDRVHYELLLTNNLLVTDARQTRRIRPNTENTIQNDHNHKRMLMASPSDARTASRYGLQCQVNCINYQQDNWVHADLTREEYLSVLTTKSTQSTMKAKTHNDANTNYDHHHHQSQQQQQQRPLWELASASSSANAPSSFPGSEAIIALFRPSTPTTPPTLPVQRRLFSNLFLPGDAFTGLIRTVLWTAVPSPELSIMVLDWSSIVPRPMGGGVSPVALPVLECLFTGNLMEARKLIFGQMLVSGQGAVDVGVGVGVGVDSLSNDNDDNFYGSIHTYRNDHALRVLQSSMEHDECHTNALLYGISHCRDLHRKLEGMGFSLRKVEWRTAWSVVVPTFGTGPKTFYYGNTRRTTTTAAATTTTNAKNSSPLETFAASASPMAIAIGLVVLPAYLAVGGLDWLATIQDVGKAIDKGHLVDGVVDALLYVARHAALYLGLSKFVVEWDGASLFGNDEEGP